MSAAERLADVQERIAVAAERVGRLPSAVRLIVVSKTFPAEAVAPLLDAGHRDFGENRLQEAQGKWPDLLRRHPGIRLHLIGRLQSNKLRDAVALFHCIHSVDREKLALGLAAEMGRQGRALPLFVQVNTGAEPQKAGVAPPDVADFVRRGRDVHGLRIEGLMCIPPLAGDPAPHFRLLRRLADQLQLRSLSMGMSGDFEIAIAHGATHVRVGSAIFGERG